MLSNIKVGIRIKPPSVAGKERSRSRSSTVTDCNETSLTFKGKQFTFDRVFPTSISQKDLYCQTAEPMLRSFMEGYNVTIMAYGQTGSGKTYTMGTSGMSQEDEEKQGLIPRFVTGLFENIRQHSADKVADGQECGRPCPNVTVSFAEIYGEDVYDLMPACDGNSATNISKDKSSVRVRENAGGDFFVEGLREVQVNSAGEALDYLRKGSRNRITASTSMNATSSRSHTVITVTLEQFLTPRGASRGRGSTELHGADSAADTGADRMISKLTFVDLAGSECLDQTNATRQRLKEGIQINKDLLTIGKVITVLAENQSQKQGAKNAFVPYRDSKLTLLLKDALGGNSQTLFLACVSPTEKDKGLTKSTIGYAQAARNIQNKPVRNMDRTQMELRRLQYTVKAWMIKACGHMFSEAALSAAAAGSPSRLTGAARLRASPLPPSLFSESSSHANAQNEKESSSSAPPFDVDLLKRPDVQEYVNAVNTAIAQRLQHDLGQGDSILSPMKKHARLSLGVSPVRPLSNIRSRVSHIHRDDLPAGRMARKCEMDDEAPRRGSVLTNLQIASTESLQQSSKYPEETERLVAHMIEILHEKKDMRGLQLDTEQQEVGEEKETILHQPMSSVKGYGAEMALLQDENRRLRARVEEFERQRASGLYEACKDCNASVRHSTSSLLSDEEESDGNDDDKAARAAELVSCKRDASAPSRKGRLLRRKDKISGAKSAVLSDDDMETLIFSPVRDVSKAGKNRSKRVVASSSDEDAPDKEKSAGLSRSGRMHSRGATSMLYFSEDEDEDEDAKSLAEESRQHTRHDESSGDDGQKENTLAVIETNVVRGKRSGTGESSTTDKQRHMCGYRMQDDEVCDKKITTSDSCNKHRKIHSDKKPDACRYVWM